MKVTKFVHSCLLIEDNGQSVLIDPGSYSKEAVLAYMLSLTNLDYVLITHEHYDHLDSSLVQNLLSKFPQVKIMSNSSVQALLQKEGISVLTQGDEHISIEEVPHEKILGPTPQNFLFHVFGKLTHPGDSHSFNTSKEILALPVQAPWGSMVAAVDLAIRLKPKYVIPIHDWHWNDEARTGLYQGIGEYLGKNGIKFLDPKNEIKIE